MCVTDQLSLRLSVYSVVPFRLTTEVTEGHRGARCFPVKSGRTGQIAADNHANCVRNSRAVMTGTPDSITGMKCFVFSVTTTVALIAIAMDAI